MTVYASKDFNIYGHEIKAEIVLVGDGQSPVSKLSINGTIWTRWNLDNHKSDPTEDWKNVETYLKDGSYRMFI